MHFLVDPYRLPIHPGCHFLALGHQDCEFRVPVAQLATVVDVGRPAYGDVIVHDHQLAVDVDLLGHRPVVQQAVVAQREELYVLFRMWG